jgi:hypothetical protein
MNRIPEQGGTHQASSSETELALATTMKLPIAELEDAMREPQEEDSPPTLPSTAIARSRDREA